MRKPTICICKKGADQLHRNCAIVFATEIVQSRLYVYPKCQASGILLCLYSSGCVQPVRKPHGWFSHDAAQLLSTYMYELHVCIALEGFVVVLHQENMSV